MHPTYLAASENKYANLFLWQTIIASLNFYNALSVVFGIVTLYDISKTTFNCLYALNSSYENYVRVRNIFDCANALQMVLTKTGLCFVFTAPMQTYVYR